jgi:hypothetical protein
VSVAPVGPIALDVGQSELFTATAGSGSGTLYYQWYIGGSLVGTDSSIYTFVASSAGSIQVYVSVTDSASTPYTVKSNVASVTVNSVLSVAVSPSPVALDVGQVQTFTASASGGSGALHYQWCLDGNAVGSDNSSYSYNATAGPHEVYVNVTDSASVPVTAESNIASVTVNPTVTVSIAPASWIMDVGQAKLFNSSISGGTSPYVYQWYLNDVAVSGATSATWTFTPISFGSYGVYVNVTDNVGFRAISNIASVTVNPVLSVSIAPGSTRLDVGDTQMFNSTVSGGTLLALSYTYQWYLNGTPVSDAIGSTWNFTPTSPGSYTVYVKVTDSIGAQATSNTATAMASPQPLSPISYLILVAVAAAAIVVGLAVYEILKRSVSARPRRNM